MPKEFNLLGAFIILALIEEEMRKRENGESNAPQSNEHNSREERIQNQILDLPDAGITTLMQVLGKWNNNKRLLEYSPENIGELVHYGNSLGLDVELRIECGRDYHIIGRKIRNKHTGEVFYQIAGLLDEYDEFADLLDIHALVGEIAADGFDGDSEAGIAGGGVQPPETGQLFSIN